MKQSKRSLLAGLRSVAAISTMAISGITLCGMANAEEVDLLMLYDDYSYQHFDGQPETAMRNWVDQINAAYENSNVDIQLRLVGTLRHQIEGSSMGDVLGKLRQQEFVQQKRDELGADFVSQLHQTGRCGVGYVSVNKWWAYNVVGPTCGPLTLAHELGHNMGLMHSRRQGDEGGARYRYGLGYGVDNYFGTIMSYYWLFSGQRASKFSNPRIDCVGLPCGIPEGEPEEADASKALNNVRAELAGFMETKVDGGNGDDDSDDGSDDDSGLEAIVYQHYYFNGYSAALEMGEYRLSDLQALGVKNNDLSSIKVPEGLSVQLFDGDNFTGTKTVYDDDHQGFPQGSVNDTTTSIIVTSSDDDGDDDNGNSNGDIEDGTYFIKAKHSEKCLDVYGGYQSNGARLIQWGCHGGDNQRWIVETNSDGYSALMAKHSGQCMTVKNAETRNGAAIVQQPCNSQPNQLWQIEELNDGSFRLTAQHSDRVADISGVSQRHGAAVHQWSWWDGDNQHFLFEQAE